MYADEKGLNILCFFHTNVVLVETGSISFKEFRMGVRITVYGSMEGCLSKYSI